MKLHSRVIISLVLTILFIGIAVLVWANQTNRITIWGEGWGDTSTAIISVSNIGGDLVHTESSTTFYPDGLVVRHYKNIGHPDFKSCYTPEELTALKNSLDQVGFWTATGSGLDMPGGIRIYASYNNQKKTLEARSYDELGTLGTVAKSIFAWPETRTNRTLANGVCNTASTTQVTATVSPVSWATTVKTNSENHTQEFNVGVSVTPMPTGNCEKAGWEATTTDSRLKLKGPLATDYSNKASSTVFVGAASCTQALPPSKFTARYDISGLANGTYQSSIAITGTYSQSQSQILIIPIIITINESGLCQEQTYEGKVGYDSSSGKYGLSAVATMPPFHITYYLEPKTGANINLANYVGKIVRISGCVISVQISSKTISVASITEISQPSDTQPPTAPGNLTGTVNSATQATITWTPSTDNVGVVRYELFNADNNASVVSIPGLNDNINDNRIVLSNLSPNTTYRYYLRAIDAVGNYSNPSNTITITTPSSGDGGSGGGTSGGGTSGSGSSGSSSISRLVSTGQALWFNILIALILAGIVLYLGMKKPVEDNK